MIKTNNKGNRILLLIMTLVMLLSMSMPIYAADAKTSINEIKNENQISIGISTTDETDIKAAITNANKNIGESSDTALTIGKKDSSQKLEKYKVLQFDDGYLYFSVDGFKASKQKDLKKAMKGFIDYLKTSSISNDTQNEIMNQIQDSDSDVRSMMIPIVFGNMNADMYTALKWLAPLLVVLRVILGIGTTFVVILLFCSTVIDLAYIGLPMWREAQAEKQGGGDKKPFGVSYEAITTVREVEKELGEYKNAYIMYGKRRATTYIVLAVCILYLIAGEIGGLMAWIINLASGIVK